MHNQAPPAESRGCAILGDIHANWPALKAVINHCHNRGIRRFFSVGDIVGYYARPKECLDALKKIRATIVQGNHEILVTRGVEDEPVGAEIATILQWTRKTLGKDDIEFLRRLPLTFHVGHPELACRLVHATVSRPWEWRYVKSLNDAIGLLTLQDTPVCFFGHTHQPIVYSFGREPRSEPLDRLVLAPDKRYLINVGSVGQPRDGTRGAQVVIFDPDRGELFLERVDYDVDLTIRDQRAAGLPEEPLHLLRD